MSPIYSDSWRVGYLCHAFPNAHNPCLTSLAVLLSNLHFKAFAELQVIAYSCPNLKRLSIKIDQSDYKTKGGPLQWQNHTNRPLALHTLELDGVCPGLAGGLASIMVTEVSTLRGLSIANVRIIPDLDCENLTSFANRSEKQQEGRFGLLFYSYAGLSKSWI